MKKLSRLIIISLFLIVSAKAQKDDKELYSLLQGDWYSFFTSGSNLYSYIYSFDSLSPEDSIYTEYSFFEHEFDYQMSALRTDGSVPFTIRDGYLFTWDTANIEGYSGYPKILFIDSNNVVLYNQEDTLRLRRLITEEYTLSDFIHDRSVLFKATIKMHTPYEFSSRFDSQLPCYYQTCIIRREFLWKLERGELKKDAVIKYITEFYLDSPGGSTVIIREFKEFIQKIDMLYPDNQP